MQGYKQIVLPLLCLLGTPCVLAADPRSTELTMQALALTPDPAEGEVLYLKQCARCHKRSAEGNGPKWVPALAGQREYYLLLELVHFSTLDRTLPQMHEVLTRPDVNRAQALRDIAAYLARKERHFAVDHGDKRFVAAGERVYRQACAMCHGKNGEGSNAEPIPAIGGQHYFYLIVRLDDFASGHSNRADPPIPEFTAGLSAQEREGVADYISRLPGK